MTSDENDDIAKTSVNKSNVRVLMIIHSNIASEDDKDKTLLKIYKTKVSSLPPPHRSKGNRVVNRDVKRIYCR